MLTPEQEEDAAKARAAIIEISARSYDRAAAYTNLVTLGGFAGAFTIWNFTRDQLSDKATLLIALLLGISLAFFVFFEIFKMVWTTRTTREQLAIIKLPSRQFLDRLAEIHQKQDEATLNFIMRVWAWVMFICVGTGLLAVALLFYNFFALLLGCSSWPS